MTAHPLGEGVDVTAGLDFDQLLRVPEPTIDLLEPKTAPQDMLAEVRVNTEGQCLELATPVGTIAVELYWRANEFAEEERGDFFAALPADLDPDAAANPIATQEHPYTVLPDGALYEVAVRAPLDAVSKEWTEHTVSVGGGVKSLFGVSLAEFRGAYPSVDVSSLPEGSYTITATERRLSTLVVAARVENGEPLSRMQTITGDQVHYRETLTGGFRPSALRPDTAVSVIDSRVTMRDGEEEADRQRLQFAAHDGFQRTGEGAAENSGAVEVIVMEGTIVENTGFTFTPFQPLIVETQGYGGGYGFDEPMRGFGTRGGGAFSYGGSKSAATPGLSGGETRYRPPETVRVSMVGVRDLRAVAAFRFAMAAAPVAEAPAE